MIVKSKCDYIRALHILHLYSGKCLCLKMTQLNNWSTWRLKALYIFWHHGMSPTLAECIIKQGVTQMKKICTSNFFLQGYAALYFDKKMYQTCPNNGAQSYLFLYVDFPKRKRQFLTRSLFWGIIWIFTRITLCYDAAEKLWYCSILLFL